MTSASTQSTPADWYRIINTVWSSSLLQMSHTLCCVSSKRLSSATQTLKVSLGVFSVSQVLHGAGHTEQEQRVLIRWLQLLQDSDWICEFVSDLHREVLDLFCSSRLLKKKETRHSRYSSASHLTVCSDFCLTRSAAPATTALQLVTVNCALISASG